MDSNLELFSDQEIQDIIDKDILELVGAENMPQEQKEALYKKIGHTIQLRVAARIDDMFSDEEKEQWKALLEKNNREEMLAFLRSKNIDIAQMIVEEAIVYKTEMAALFKNLKENNG